MANSRVPNKHEIERSILHTGYTVAQPQRLLGRRGAASPDTKSLPGDTPSSVGINDHAAQSNLAKKDANRNALAEIHMQRNDTLELIEFFISQGNVRDRPMAAHLMWYWRQGGDDRQAGNRPDVQWKNVFGSSKSGIRGLSKSIFWPVYAGRLPAFFEAHRQAYIEAAKRELGLDACFNLAGWELERAKQTVVSYMDWGTASGIFNPTDLQLAFGGCAVNTKVRIGVKTVVRDGTTLDPEQAGDVQKGDILSLQFSYWEVFLSDRYKWGTEHLMTMLRQICLRWMLLCSFGMRRKKLSLSGETFKIFFGSVSTGMDLLIILNMRDNSITKQRALY